MKLNDLEIAVHNIKVDCKRLGKKKIIVAFVDWLKCLVISLIIVAIITIIFWRAFTVPTLRDSYEATKNQNWQQQVTEYKK